MMVCATALINLSLGLLGCGFIGARNCGHVKVGRKIFGGVVLALSASAIILLHFALAHYRNALDILAADGAAAANADVMLHRLAAIPLSLRETIKNDPWVFLGNIHALTVFLAGIGFAIAAGCEGYWLVSDCYPGFEAADRIYRNALETVERQKRSFADAIAETVNEVRNLLDSAVRQGEERLNVAKIYFDRAREITRRYADATLEIEYAMLEIIDEYRSHYILIRDTAGPAQWEDQEPRLDREASFTLDNLSQIEESEAANLNGLRHNADEMKIRLTVSQTLLNNQLKTYLENVDQDAKRHEEMAYADLNGIRTPPPPSGGRKKKSDVQTPKL